jgi:hypothetical protein
MKPVTMTRLAFRVEGDRAKQQEFRKWIVSRQWKTELGIVARSSENVRRKRNGVLDVELLAWDRDAESLVTAIVPRWANSGLYICGLAEDQREYGFTNGVGRLQMEFEDAEGRVYLGVPGEYEPQPFDDE